VVIITVITMVTMFVLMIPVITGDEEKPEVEPRRP